VCRKDMPTRSWSLNQHGNSFISIVIGDKTRCVYLIAKTEPKSKRLANLVLQSLVGVLRARPDLWQTDRSAAVGFAAVSPYLPNL
jgi:hypothetical protein